MTAEPGKSGLNPAALRVADAAQALGISEDMISDDLAAGAPTNADGTINLVHYAAWLNREMSKNDVP